MSDGPDQAERERLQGYLLAQAEKYSWLELWPRVVGGRLEFLDVIRDVSEEQANFAPGGEQWSIAEVGQHVLDSSRHVAQLVQQLANGKDSAHGDADPDRAPASLPWPRLREALLEDSLAFAGLIRDLPEPPAFEPRVEHTFFGGLHARAWYLFQRVHDQDHARQALAIKEAAGYPAAKR